MKRALVALVLFATTLPAVASAGIIGKPVNNLGLVGYWSFNEGTGTVAADTSGNRNAGTLVSSPAHVTGLLGNALDFDSTNYVSVPNASVLNPRSAITISAWVNADAWDNNRRIVQKGDADTQFRLTQEGATLVFDLTGVTNGNLGVTLPSAGVWHHIVGTYNGATTTLYIDGVSAGSQAASGQIAATTDNLYFATKNASAPAGDHWNGQIDEVRMYNRALSAAEVAALYRNRSGSATVGSASALSTGSSLKNGLVGYWTFDNADVTDKVYDKSGSGGHGYFGNVATSSVKTVGKLGQASRFNLGNQYVRIPAGATNGLTAFTACFWTYLRPTSPHNGVFLSNYDASANSGWDVYFSNYTSSATSGAIGTSFGGGGGDYTYVEDTLATIRFNEWTHVCAQQNGNTSAAMRRYINGVVVATPGAQGGNARTSDAGNDLYINNTVVAGSGVIDTLDDVRIYNRLLSSNEITQLYNLGNPTMNSSATRLQKGTTLSSGLVAHYTFDNLDMQTSVRDVAGGYNGQVSGASTSSVKVAGKLGQAIRLDGIDDFIATTTFNQALLPATITHWAKVDGTGLNACDATVFSRSGGDVSGINIPSCQNTGRVGYHWLGASNTFNWAGGPLLPLNKWFFVALVVESTKATLYVYSEDGLNSAVNSVTHTSSTLSQLKIGQDDIGNRFYKGIIDDVRIYNRALSASEVLQLYNMGK